MGGHDRDTTPRLRAIADSPAGAAYDECIAHSQWTLGSSGAILSGTYPSHSTVGMDGDRLPAELSTAAELFGDVGYHTACLSGNSHVSDATGLSRGFDRFEWLSSSTLPSVAGPRTLAKYALNLRRHSAGFSTDPARHSSPFLMNDIAKRWLRGMTDEEPFFFYLHYNEPHRPYHPPLAWLDRYTDGLDVDASEAAEISMDVHYDMTQRIADGCDLSGREWDALLAMYDAEVAYTDEMIGRLFEFVSGLDVGETVFVVTADHGELFGEHDLLSHRFVLHDALVNVPLVVHGADLNLAHDDLVQHIDLMGTLLARAGGDTSQFQGVDLDEETREYAVSQRSPMGFESYLDANPEFDVSRFHSGLLTAMRTHEFKFQRSDERGELLRLPEEEVEVSETFPEVRAEMEAATEEWLGTIGKPISAGERAEFTDAMRGQLADLGYLE